VTTPSSSRTARHARHSPTNGCSSFSAGSIASDASCATIARTASTRSSFSTRTCSAVGGSTRGRLRCNGPRESGRRWSGNEPASSDYTFGRVHQTLRVTPAVEAGLADMSGPSKKSSPSSGQPENVLVYVEWLRQQAEEFQRTVEKVSNGSRTCGSRRRARGGSGKNLGSDGPPSRIPGAGRLKLTGETTGAPFRVCVAQRNRVLFSRRTQLPLTSSKLSSRFAAM
jgi:hypothetical protein